MKYSILLITLLATLVACSPSPITSKGGTAAPGAGSPTDPNNTKPNFSGKPGDFNNNWRGPGSLENTGAKTKLNVIYSVKVEQNIDATSGLPKDLAITLVVTDKAGDILYSVALNGFVITVREVDKTTFIYEIYETSTKTKVGEIGENAFSFRHAYPGRIISIDVSLKNMHLNGFKMVGKTKTVFRSQLAVVP